jgi:hypothetical protein
MDPDADPAIFVIDLQDAKKKKKIRFFCLLLFEGTFTSFSKIKSQKKSQSSRNQVFSYYFCLVLEGSGSGVGSGSRRPKNMWIRWIRIRNTGSASPQQTFRRESWGCWPACPAAAPSWQCSAALVQTKKRHQNYKPKFHVQSKMVRNIFSLPVPGFILYLDKSKFLPENDRPEDTVRARVF